MRRYKNAQITDTANQARLLLKTYLQGKGEAATRIVAEMKADPYGQQTRDFLLSLEVESEKIEPEMVEAMLAHSYFRTIWPDCLSSIK